MPYQIISLFATLRYVYNANKYKFNLSLRVYAIRDTRSISTNVYDQYVCLQIAHILLLSKTAAAELARHPETANRMRWYL